MIKKTNFIARINHNKEIFVIGSNGKLIPNTFQVSDLPFIFGKPEIKEFLKFKQIVDQSKFSFDEVDSLYFFPSKRWDIELKSNIVVRLPMKNLKGSLDQAFKFLANKDHKNNLTLDARIEGQIIFND